MRRAVRAAALVVLVLAMPFARHAHAEDFIIGGDATNNQEGDNEGSTNQDSSGGSGDAIAGQVVGDVSSGDSSIDATNNSTDVSVESGDAEGHATAAGFAGQNVSSGTAIQAADIANIGDAVNVQAGDNAWSVSQTLVANSGDAIGGQVIGVVTSAGGSADVVAANTSEDVDVETGDATANAAAAGFGGLNATASTTNITAASINTVATATNVHDSSDRASATQTGTATTGDGVGGQVLGVVSAGDSSVDATNSSTDVDIASGDADTDQTAALFGGQNATTDATTITAASVRNVGQAVNVQDESNSASASQTATASSGDGVGGQVVGAVTSAGGTTDIVAANTSDDVDVETGDATVDQTVAAFSGLNVSASDTVVQAAGDEIENVTANNAQLGNNRSSASQTGDASTGDGVGGQVIGVVSAGDTSVDATNRSEDVDVETGDADSEATYAAFVGLNVSTGSPFAVAAGDGIINTEANNILLGEGMGPGNESSANQTTSASSGDGVAGQVVGAVTSAGGSADIVAANTSEDVDAETGDAEAEATVAAVVGHNDAPSSLALAAGDDIVNASGTNVQLGDNTLEAVQTATSETGDAVGGQVLGVVSAGDASVDATNHSEDVDVETGDAEAEAVVAAFVGLASATSTQALAQGDTILSQQAENVQLGNNTHEVIQTVTASSGDAVGGQVSGVVTSAGGSADLVLANTSEDADAETGDAEFDAVDTSFTGLSAVGSIALF